MRFAVNAKRIICIEPFPANWSPKKVVEKTIESLKNIFEVTQLKQGKLRFRGKTIENMIIETITKADGEVITFYPKSFTKNYGKKL